MTTEQKIRIADYIFHNVELEYRTDNTMEEVFMKYPQLEGIVTAMKNAGVPFKADKIADEEVASVLSRASVYLKEKRKALEGIDKKILIELSNMIVKELKGEEEMNIGGNEMANRTKLEGYKKAGLDGLLKMGAFNPALFSDKEFLKAMEELKSETKPVVKEVKTEATAETDKEAKEIKLEQIMIALGQMKIGDIMKKYENFEHIVEAIKSHGVKLLKKDKLIEVLTKLDEETAAEIMDKIDETALDNIIAVMNSEKEEGTTSNNKIKGGNAMKQTAGTNAAGTQGTNTQGGQTMEKGQRAGTQAGQNTTENKIQGGQEMKQGQTTGNQTKGTAMKAPKAANAGTSRERVWHLTVADKEGYFNLSKYIITRFGRKGLEGLEEIGVRMSVVAIKEEKTLIAIMKRIALFVGIEWVKTEIDNDLLEIAGSAVQGYLAVRIGFNLYTLKKSYSSVKAKDVEDLNKLLAELVAEEKALAAKDKNEEEDENMAM